MAKIMVVDGDPVIQLTIRQVLERAGRAIVVAEDSPRGLSKLRAGQQMWLFLKPHPDASTIMTSDQPQTPDSILEPDHFTMVMTLSAVSAPPMPFKPATLLATFADGLASASPAGRSEPGYDALSNA